MSPMLEDWLPGNRAQATAADATEEGLLGATVLGVGLEDTQQSSEGQRAGMPR